MACATLVCVPRSTTDAADDAADDRPPDSRATTPHQPRKRAFNVLQKQRDRNDLGLPLHTPVLPWVVLDH
jgi:hypothetical protein